jgi:hypothetical protein
MPLEGKSADWLKEEMERLRSMEKSDVQEGRVSGAVYHVSSRKYMHSASTDGCHGCIREEKT